MGYDHSKDSLVAKNEFKDELPEHKVNIKNDFMIGKYQVTFNEYDTFCKATKRDKPNKTIHRRNQHPVICVSWHDAQDYCQWLSEQSGMHYRLLSEAEWEYACRAGTTTRFSFGEDSQANFNEYTWYEKNSKSKTHPVGKKKPNPWGLYDMHGNVWEWCEDKYTDSYNNTPRDGSSNKEGKEQVIRGGSWQNFPNNLTTTIRLSAKAGEKEDYIGFRIAKNI